MLTYLSIKIILFTKTDCFTRMTRTPVMYYVIKKYFIFVFQLKIKAFYGANYNLPMVNFYMCDRHLN